MAATESVFARRAYPTSWPMPDRAEVLPVAGLLTRNADIDLRRDELRWTAGIA
jgi:hypothetical protein